MEASWATESEASPEGSEAAIPMSSVGGTDADVVEANVMPASAGQLLNHEPPWMQTLEIVASVNSAPLWQLVQPPLPEAIQAELLKRS